MHTPSRVAVPAQPQHTSTPALEYLAEQLAIAMAPYPRQSVELHQQRHHNLRPGCTLVPAEVWAALDCAHPDRPVSRDDLALRVAPLMAIADWRFCSCYRHGATAAHRFVYRLVATVEANIYADARQAAYQQGTHDVDEQEAAR